MTNNKIPTIIPTNDYAFWTELLKNKSVSKEFVSSLQAFNDKRYSLIKRGFISGLTENQVKIFANPLLTDEVAEEVHTALAFGVKEETVSYWLRENYSDGELSEIFRGYTDGLTEEQIKFYATLETALKMQSVRDAFNNGVTIERLSIFSPLDQYDYWDMRELISAILSGITEENLRFLANPDLDSRKRQTLKEIIQRGTSKEFLEFFNKHHEEFESAQLMAINRAYREGLTKEQLEVVINPKFNEWQMDIIINAFWEGLSFEEVNIFARPNFPSRLMSEIKWLIKQKWPMAEIHFVIRNEFSADQITRIIQGKEKGLTDEQIEVYKDSRLDYQQMGEIIEGFNDGLTIKEVLLYANPDNKASVMKEIREGINDGIPYIEYEKLNKRVFTLNEVEKIRTEYFRKQLEDLL